jgi:hypothetical protein
MTQRDRDVKQSGEQPNSQTERAEQQQAGNPEKQDTEVNKNRVPAGTPRPGNVKP